MESTNQNDIYYSKKNQGILSERYCIIKTLSEDGGTAKVKLAYDLKTHEQCAVKIMRKLDKSHQVMLLQEVGTMKKLNHPNILSMIDYGHSEIKSTIGKVKENCLYMALQLAQKETLFDFVTQIPNLPFPEKLAGVLFKQFLLGL